MCVCVCVCTCVYVGVCVCICVWVCICFVFEQIRSSKGVSWVRLFLHFWAKLNPVVLAGEGVQICDKSVMQMEQAKKGWAWACVMKQSTHRTCGAQCRVKQPIRVILSRSVRGRVYNSVIAILSNSRITFICGFCGKIFLVELFLPTHEAIHGIYDCNWVTGYSAITTTLNH